VAVTATHFDDPGQGFGDDLRRDGESYTAVKHYRVNTRRLVVALAAPGLPAAGSAFDVSVPRCIARSFSPVRRGGVDNGLGEDAFTIVRVDFSDQANQGRFVTHGSKFTQFEPSVQSVQAIFGAGDSAGTKPIAGGEGVAKDVGTVAAKIHTYARDAAGVTLPRLIQLQSLQAVNEAAILLPPIYSDGTTWAIQPKQARYHSYELDFDQGLVRLTHTLLLAEDHKARWRDEDDKGNAIGPIQEREIYEARSFAGLW